MDVPERSIQFIRLTRAIVKVAASLETVNLLNVSGLLRDDIRDLRFEEPSS